MKRLLVCTFALICLLALPHLTAAQTVNQIIENLSPDGGLRGIDLSPDGTRAYVTDTATGMLYRIDLTTVQIDTAADGLIDPYGVAINSMETMAYVTERGAGALSAVDLATGSVTRIADGLGEPIGLDVSAAEDTAVVLDTGSGTLYKVDLTAGTASPIAQPGGNIVTVNDAGTIAYTDAGVMVDLTTGAVSGGLPGGWGIDLGPSEDVLFVGGNTFFRHDLLSGYTAEIAHNMDSSDIAVAPSGTRIYVVDSHHLYEIIPLDHLEVTIPAIVPRDQHFSIQIVPIDAEGDSSGFHLGDISFWTDAPSGSPSRTEWHDFEPGGFVQTWDDFHDLGTFTVSARVDADTTVRGTSDSIQVIEYGPWADPPHVDPPNPGGDATCTFDLRFRNGDPETQRIAVHFHDSYGYGFDVNPFTGFDPLEVWEIDTDDDGTFDETYNAYALTDSTGYVDLDASADSSAGDYLIAVHRSDLVITYTLTDPTNDPIDNSASDVHVRITSAPGLYVNPDRDGGYGVSFEFESEEGAVRWSDHGVIIGAPTKVWIEGRPLMLGGEIAIPVHVENLPGNWNGQDMLSYQFDLRLDRPELLTGDPEIRLDGTMSEGYTLAVGHPEGFGDREIRVGVANPGHLPPLGGDGILCNIVLRLADDPGYIDEWLNIGMENFQFNEFSGEELPLVIWDASFQMQRILFGDVSGNGEATAYDAALLLQFVVGNIGLDDHQRFVADVSGNGEPTAYDAALILQLVVGNISCFPVEGCDVEFLGKRIAGVVPALTLPSVLHATSEGVTVPLSVQDGSGITSAQVTVQYDPDVLMLETVSRTDLTETYELAYRDAEGRVQVALAGAQPIDGSGALANLHFRVLENLPSAIRFEAARLDERSVSVGEVRIVQGATPTEYALMQNHPNPFNPETAIRYDLPQAGPVLLAVYTAGGQRIRTLVDGPMPAGEHRATWDGRDEAGRAVASGVYLYRIQAGNFVKTHKALLIR